MSELAEQLRAGRSMWIDLAPDASGVDGDAAHCTLLFLGKMPDVDAGVTTGRVRTILVSAKPDQAIRAHVGGIALFGGNQREGSPVVHLLQSPYLRRLRDALRAWIEEAGVKLRADDFDYTPHVTLYRAPYEQAMTLGPLLASPYEFTHIRLCCGDVCERWSLG